MMNNLLGGNNSSQNSDKPEKADKLDDALFSKLKSKGKKEKLD